MTTVSTKSGKIINVVSREEESKTLTLSDREMDARAVEAVKAAINKVADNSLFGAGLIRSISSDVKISYSQIEEEGIHK